jgi:hypothetical protein
MRYEPDAGFTLKGYLAAAMICCRNAPGSNVTGL